MSQLIYKTVVLFLLTALSQQGVLANSLDVPLNTPAELLSKKEFTRNIKKEFDISANGLVNMNNMYGKVDIKTWNQKQVKVDVTITVNASSESNAEEVFDRIKVDFSNGNDYVNAETIIESSNKSWISSWWSGSDNGDFTIDYEVFMPASANLELSNKYGHSTVGKLEGKATVTVKYGDVSMEGVSGNLLLDVGYGNASVELSGDVDANIKYGKLRLESARDINLESKYSKIYITKAGNLTSISKYDTYRVGTINELQNQGKYDDFEIESASKANIFCRYSDFTIKYLSQRGELNMEYGGLKVDQLAKGFAKMEVTARYTDIKIGIESGTPYEMDIATTYAGIHYPDGADIHYDVNQGSSHEVRGYVGAKGSNRLIHIRANYGNVKLW